MSGHRIDKRSDGTEFRHYGDVLDEENEKAKGYSFAELEYIDGPTAEEWAEMQRRSAEAA